MFNFGGGMLTGAEIERQIKKGNIQITPYDPKCINPNSYNLKLHPELLVYKRGSIDNRASIVPTTRTFDIATGKHILNTNNYKEYPECPYLESTQLDPIDMNKDNETIKFTIGEEGFILQPGVLYIGRTVERTFTDKFIPMINGRSSGGRLGISIHITAGFGDIGFDGTWTLEITAVEPVIIYPYTEIAQVCYFKPCGNTRKLYNGRYNGQIDPTASRFFKPKEEVYK